MSPSKSSVLACLPSPLPASRGQTSAHAPATSPSTPPPPPTPASAPAPAAASTPLTTSPSYHPTLKPLPMPPAALVHTFRSNANGVGGAIRAARGRVLRAARGKKWRFDRQKFRTILMQLQSTHHAVEAEVGEFIQSPHLLFRPLRLVAVLAFPLLVPLYFMPPHVLFFYVAFVIVWYLFCVLFFATEVAMRPPWYKTGLPSTDLPPYWRNFVNDPKTDLGLDFESVEFRSLAGTTLRAWFVHPSSDVLHRSQMILFVHGAGRDRRAFLRHSQHFLDAGYPCLLFDFSEHGLSDPVTPGVSRGSLFAAREQYDVLAAAAYLKNARNASQVAVIGTSCGASSAILAAAEQPHLFSCVVAENPFARADDLLQFHLHALSQNYLSQNQHQLGRRAVFWLAGKLLMVRMGYYLNSYGAIDAVPHMACPLLVLHSRKDDIVPYGHGEDIYNVALTAKGGDERLVKFEEFPDAIHSALYDGEPERWTEIVMKFLEDSLVPGNRASAGRARQLS